MFGRCSETNGVGDSAGEIEVDLRLSVLNLLNGTWLVSLSNHLTGSVGKRQIAKGRSKAGISELVQGEKTISLEDPFDNIEAILILKLTSSAIELNSA